MCQCVLLHLDEDLSSSSSHSPRSDVTMFVFFVLFIAMTSFNKEEGGQEGVSVETDRKDPVDLSNQSLSFTSHVNQ